MLCGLFLDYSCWEYLRLFWSRLSRVLSCWTLVYVMGLIGLFCCGLLFNRGLVGTLLP